MVSFRDMADQPKDSHELTAEQIKTVLDWLNAKWGDGSETRPAPKCEMCKVAKWTIAHRLVSPVAIHGHTLNLGSAFPQVMVICTNCGNIKYLNALACGVVKPDEIQPQPEEKQDVK
jgi:hypothetical protein